MRVIRRVVAVLAVAVAAAACTDQTAPTESATNPAFNFTNGPSEPNTKISRYEENWYLDISDGQLVGVVTGVTNETPAEFCAPDLVAEPVSWQDVTVGGSEEFPWVHKVGIAKEVIMAVVDFDQSGDCFGGKLFLGTGHFTWTDNDAERWKDEFGRENANVWGYTATGSVTSADGTTYRVQMRERCRWNPGEWFSCKQSVSVH